MHSTKYIPVDTQKKYINEQTVQEVKDSLAKCQPATQRHRLPFIHSSASLPQQLNSYRQLLQSAQSPLQQYIIIYALLASRHHGELKKAACTAIGFNCAVEAIEAVKNSIHLLLNDDKKKLEQLVTAVRRLVDDVKHTKSADFPNVLQVINVIDPTQAPKI